MPEFSEYFLVSVVPPWSNFVLPFTVAPALPVLCTLEVTECNRAHQVVKKGMQNKTLSSKIQEEDSDKISHHQFPGNLLQGHRQGRLIFQHDKTTRFFRISRYCNTSETAKHKAREEAWHPRLLPFQTLGGQV